MNKEIIKKIDGQVCCWVIEGLGEMMGKPLMGLIPVGNELGEYICGISNPRALRTIQVNANDPTPPNAVRMNGTTALVFLPLITRADEFYFAEEYPFSVVQDKALLNAYIAATTGLVMAGAKIEEVKK